MAFSAPLPVLGFAQAAVTRDAVSSNSELTDRSYDSRVSQKSEPTNLGRPRICSIADALEVVGERWSLLVLRELSFGVRRFSDIQVNTGAPRETLALRLRKLEEAGIIERRRYSDHPPRDEYVLTAAGRDLAPVLTALREWGERHVTPSGAPAGDDPRP
jgi:DNA-binding HxlR family transcriptional regulator